MNRCVQDAYESLASQVEQQFQERLYIRSAYRTAEEQQKTIEEDGEKAAMVNASEHQAGLALDVYVKDFAGAALIKTEAGQFVNSQCWEYGFIIRYPLGKKSITGVGYEPWHIRYVGKPHAEIIYKNKWTLEEYMESIELGILYKYNHYLMYKQSDDVPVWLPEEYQSVVVSPDNQGNHIVTIMVE